MEIKDTRIYKLREYLMKILDSLLSSDEYQLNANFLSEEVGNYSLDKVPTENNEEKWIIGPAIRREVYDLRTRNNYGTDVLDNLSNIGFFEAFEKEIEDKNNRKDFPDIEGIEKIECLNCGTLSDVNSPDTAEFSVQIQITYLK